MSVFIQKDFHHQVSDLGHSMNIELEKAKYAHDLVLVAKSGEEVTTSARLLGLWSPLVRQAACDGGRILLPDFNFSALTRLPAILIPGWTELVVTKEEMDVLEALDISTGSTVDVIPEVKLEPEEPAEVVPRQVSQVEIKGESKQRRWATKINSVPGPEQPANREVQIGRIRTGIAKIEKVAPEKRSKSQQLSLKVLSNYLEELLAQGNNRQDNVMSEAKENLIMESSKKMQPENGDYINKGNYDDGKSSVSSEKYEAKMKKMEMKPKSLLKDCDECKMKFLDDRSLMMHKKTEH